MVCIFYIKFKILKFFRLTNGTRVLCTLIQFPENHILKVIDPEIWFKRSFIGKRKSFGKFGPRWNVKENYMLIFKLKKIILFKFF